MDKNKYPIVGVIIQGCRTWLRYNDGSQSGGVWWRDEATAEDYCRRMSGMGLPIKRT